MPSCVVKSCRNNSTFQKKGQGITFHRFPKEQLWRSDWCRVIQKSRDDENWMPSKTSVVCSIHFDTNELCITKNGLRRVATNAVPKMLLFEPRNMQEKQVLPITHVKLEPNIQEYQDSNDMQVKPKLSIQVKQEPNLQVKQETTTQVEQELNIIVKQEPNMQLEEDPLNMPVKQESQYIQGQPAESHTSDVHSLRKVCHHEQLSSSFESGPPNPSSHVQEISPTTEASGLDFEQPPSIELEIQSSKFFCCCKCGHINNHFGLINKANFLPQKPPYSGAVANVSEQWSSFIEPSCLVSTSITLPQTPTGIETIATNFESFDTPRERCFKEILNEKNIKIENQKKKIKTLNQRIRRLQHRNRLIKDKLRNLKKTNLTLTQII